MSRNVRAENAGAQPSDMPVRDPPSARRKRTRDAQSAFAELIARVPDADPVLIDAARTALLGNGDRN